MNNSPWTSSSVKLLLVMNSSKNRLKNAGCGRMGCEIRCSVSLSFDSLASLSHLPRQRPEEHVWSKQWRRDLGVANLPFWIQQQIVEPRQHLSNHEKSVNRDGLWQIGTWRMYVRYITVVSKLLSAKIIDYISQLADRHFDSASPLANISQKVTGLRWVDFYSMILRETCCRETLLSSSNPKVWNFWHQKCIL